MEQGLTVTHYQCDQLSEQLLKLCEDSYTAEVGFFKSLLDQGADPNIKDVFGYHPLWYASRYGKRDLAELFLQYNTDINLKSGAFGRGETALHAACEHGHVGVANLLLQHGVVVDSQDGNCRTALHLASSSGHTDVVKLLVDSGAQIDKKDNNGQTSLHCASSGGHTDVVKLLVDSNAEIDKKDNNGQTALHLASSSGHTDVVKLLVDSGAQIDNEDKDGQKALQRASSCGHTGVVKLLVDSGAQIYDKDKGQQLLKLCKDGCTAEVGVFKNLLDQGVDPNLQDVDGCHPLWYASRYGKRDLVELFLKYEADVNLKTKNGRTALHLASSNGHTDVAKLLVDSGAQIDNKDKDGRAALHHASISGHTAVVKLLVDSGAQIDNKDKNGQTAVHHACSSGHTDVVKLLANSGAEIDKRDNVGRRPLHSACISGHTAVVKLLVNSGAWIDNGGRTALNLASNGGHTDLVKLLVDHHAEIEKKENGEELLRLCKEGCTAEVGVFRSLLDKGVDSNIQDEDGRHPLWYASCYGKRDLVELFLQYNADVNLKTTKGFVGREGTALHAACEHGHMDVASILLQHGAVVNSRDKYYGQTALHHASLSGHTDVVKLLVNSGAQIDNEDEFGRRALHSASYSGHTDVVKLLVDSGAQIDNKDKDGRTALHHASNSGHTDVVKVLVDSGAEIDNKDNSGLTPLKSAKREGHSKIVSLLEEALTIEEKPLALVPVKTEVKEEAAKDEPTLAQPTAAWDLRGVEVCGEMTVVLHSSGAQQITWEGFGLKLRIAEDSLPAGIDQCTLTIKASLSGQYEFPDNSYLVSAVYWLRCEPMHRFTKPVKVEMQHCARSENVANLKLKFVRAVCSQKQLPYTFKELGGDFTSHSPYGVVEVTSFSGLATLFFGVKPEKEYCSQLFYIAHPSSCNIRIDFVVTWNLEAHLTAVEKEYASKGTIFVIRQPVYFESKSITLDIPMEGISESGWTITPLMRPVVTKEQVDNFVGGQLTPCCHLLAEGNGGNNILKRQVNLQGAKYPHNVFVISLPAGGAKDADQPEGNARVIKREVKPGQITGPDRLFSELSTDIGDSYMDIGIVLGLTYQKLRDELETGEYESKRASEKAIKMLQLWKESVTEEEFTYAVLAAALEQKGHKRCAEQYCYTTHVSI